MQPLQIMETLAILNQKGGSGKTTTTINLASFLVELGKTVLVLDLDPQGSASKWLGFENTTKGLYDFFTGNVTISGLVCNSHVLGLDMIPSSPWLINSDKVLSNEIGAENILKKSLPKLGNKWDYLLIDCPPNLGIMSLNALNAVKKVLIPVETHIMAVQGLVQLLQTIQTVQDRLNPELKIDGILPCRVNHRTRLSKNIVADLRKRFKNQVYDTVIRENVRLAEAPSFENPINIYAPKSLGSEDYKKLAMEIIKRNKRK